MANAMIGVWITLSIVLPVALAFGIAWFATWRWPNSGWTTLSTETPQFVLDEIERQRPRSVTIDITPRSEKGKQR